MSDERPTGAAAEHLTRIRETLESGNEWGCLPTENFVVIEHHADALAKLAAPATGSGNDNEHLAAIREFSKTVDDVVRQVQQVSLQVSGFIALNAIEHHAEALVADNAALRARLAEAEDRCERMRESIRAYRANVDGVLGQYDPDFVGEVIEGAEQLLKLGDIPEDLE